VQLLLGVQIYTEKDKQVSAIQGGDKIWEVKDPIPYNTTRSVMFVDYDKSRSSILQLIPMV
jgi:ligand-binding sensor protein